MRASARASDESIGLSIIESGRASVRRNSITSSISPDRTSARRASAPTVPRASSPVAASTGRKSSPSPADDASARREARRARFASVLDDCGDSPPVQRPSPKVSPKAASSPKDEEPSVGLSLVERQIAARRSARRASLANAEAVAAVDASPSPKAEDVAAAA